MELLDLPSFITIASGIWQLGNIVSIVYIMVVLRRESKAATTSPEQADELMRDSVRKELLPRIFVYLVGTVILQVLGNVLG